MTTATNALKHAFRDYVADGIPASGSNEPDKAEIRTGFDQLGLEIAGTAIDIRRYATVAVMQLDTAQVAGTLGYVYANNGNADDVSNGFYQWMGSAWEAAAWVMNQVAAAARPLIKGAIEDTTIQVGTNTALGVNSIAANTGVSNTAFGAAALRDATGHNNTGVGDGALRAMITGGDNVGVGAAAARAITLGSRNTFVGASAALLRTVGSDNVIVGFGANGSVAGGGSFNVAVGREALDAYPGDEAVAVGAYSLLIANGVRNVAIGALAGGVITNGEYNVFVGYSAGNAAGQSESASNSIAIGFGAVTTRENQITLGNRESDELRLFDLPMFRKAGMGGAAVFIGNAGNLTATGGANIAIGHTAGYSLANADSNSLVGYEAGYNLTSGGNNVAVGARALVAATTASDCTAIGAGALNKMATGVGTTAVGRYSLQSLIAGGNNTAIGDAAGRNLGGEQNCLMGYGVMRFGYGNSYNVVLGQGALYNAGRAPGALPEDGGTPDGPGTPSNYNAIVGWQAFENTTGGGHTGVGANAGRSLSGGADTIFIGRNAGFGSGQKVDATGSIVIGVEAVSTRDNEIVIGSTTHTHVTINGVTFTTAQLEALLALVS